jgi:hypothetical protein
MILKAIALAACVVGFVFIAPKALADFRRARPRTDGPVSDTTEKRTGTEDTPRGGIAA